MTPTIEIENVGGIEQKTTTLSDGITILSGENATNRSSLLAGIRAALGSDKPAIRTGAKEGSVTLTLGDETYERTVTATDSGSQWDGERYVDKTDILRIFSILTRSNPLRQNVRNNNDLYDLVMAPVDTGEIEEELSVLEGKRRKVEEKIETKQKKRQEIESLKQDREDKKEQLAAAQEDLSEVESKIEEIDEQNIESDVLDRSRELNETLKELNANKKETKQEIEDIEAKITARETELSEIRSDERNDIESLREEIDEIDTTLTEIESEIDSINQDKRVLTPLQQFLNQIINKEDIETKEFNRVISMYAEKAELSDHHPDSQQADESRSDITDELLHSDTTSEKETCIICGGDLDTQYDTLLKITNLSLSNIQEEINELQSKADDLRTEKEEIKSDIQNINENRSRIEVLEEEISELNTTKDEKAEELESIKKEIKSIKSESESIEDQVVNETESKINRLRKLEGEQTELEMDIGDLENDTDNINESITQLTDKIDEIQQLEKEKLPEIKSNIQSLRTRVDDKESEVVTEFNTAMETLVSELNYDQIERVWIEKQLAEDNKGRKNISTTVFNLNIGREIDGTVTADTIDNLSESESVIVSLMFAIAGYIAHDIREESPFILIDSIEMVDASRLESLLEFIEEYTDYLIVTALPEDTSVIDTGETVTMAR